MKIVVDISNWLYNAIMECREPQYSKSLGDAVRDGTPLPKGHGKLIDADAFANFLKNISKTQRYNEFIIDKQLTGVTVDDVFNIICESLQNENSVPTIIKADVKSEEV